MKQIMSLSAMVLSAACLSFHGPSFASDVSKNSNKNNDYMTKQTEKIGDDLEKTGDYIAKETKKAADSAESAGKDIADTVEKGWDKMTDHH